MTDRQRMFDYLDDVADGLNESRNDVAEVIKQIRADIEQLPSEITKDGRRMIRRGNVFRIIDKYSSK